MDIDTQSLLRKIETSFAGFRAPQPLGTPKPLSREERRTLHEAGDDYEFAARFLSLRYWNEYNRKDIKRFASSFPSVFHFSDAESCLSFLPLFLRLWVDDPDTFDVSNLSIVSWMDSHADLVRTHLSAEQINVLVSVLKLDLARYPEAKDPWTEDTDTARSNLMKKLQQPTQSPN